MTASSRKVINGTEFGNTELVLFHRRRVDCRAADGETCSLHLEMCILPKLEESRSQLSFACRCSWCGKKLLCLPILGTAKSLEKTTEN